MSVQDALHFIHKARQDEALTHRLHALGCRIDLESLVMLGTEAGLVFTIEEFQMAYKHDWAMRWFHYRSRTVE
jgi:hypothetical protein